MFIPYAHSLAWIHQLCYIISYTMLYQLCILLPLFLCKMLVYHERRKFIFSWQFDLWFQLRKRGLPFGTLRRRKSELELDQCICPMDLDVPQSISPPAALDPDDVFEFSDTLSSPANSNEQNSSIEVRLNHIFSAIILVCVYRVWFVYAFQLSSRTCFSLT